MHGDWGVLDSWRVSGALFLHLQYEICHIESRAFALWSGFHLTSSLLSQVTRQWNRDGLSKWMRTRCCLSILSFKGMLLHLMPPPWLSSQDWKIPPKLSRYCCNFFFLSTSSYLLHICFLFMELYTLPVFYEIAKICRFRALEISNRAEDVVMSQYGQMCWSRKLFCMLKPSNEVRWCTLLVSVITTSCQGKVLLPTVA